ncbi:hypothetical protein FA15DRAFT_663807 [Coprinopsis marcescibilis]|uniref:Uncharacterized protein n=1 Tax=Coprinopsis marcescibilis TaxID=230819 RepID=A0A5C3LAL7_COPMA|nr:hypothetical protein FA15DRAFT_663807 [Coprinopsis marcescibilis]
MSVVFCLLLNRVRFIRDSDPTTSTLSKSRAALCEILATRTFRDYANSMLDLTMVLTTVWNVYSGADPKVLAQAEQELEDRVGNAIELAILGKAKRFIKSSSCQKVIQAIWTGKCVYQAESSHSILSDTYKRTPIHFYDPHKAPVLDHYRLKVPSIRSVLEYNNFLILFILYVTALEFSVPSHFNASEIIFIIYGLGFTLEKLAAMQEHGIKVYFKGTWNAFDLAFVTTFAIYVALRIYGVVHHKSWARLLGIDVLAIIACMLFPRLAFVTFKDNLMVLSLRAMIVQFAFLMCIAMFCFCGFLYALWTLSRNQAGYSVGQISWWMLDLWFGLDASGFDNATKFHPVLGPILMVTYACLSNTLLLTVLVSTLSNTFAKINEDAAAEAMFRKAVSTIEGVKADSLFSYQPPINLVALCIMLPSSWLLSPRWFHKVNVFLIRVTNFPILLGISYYERQSQNAGSDNFAETVAYLTERVYDTLPRQIKRIGLFEGFAGSGSDIDAIFEMEEEFGNSALDTTEEEHVRMPRAPRLRRDSENGEGRMKSPQRGKESSRSPARGPRIRVDSLMPSRPTAGNGNITQSFSPLAQVFQPVVVETDGTDDGTVVGDATGVSYGPATRRRLTSIVQGKRPDNLLQQAHANALKRSPTGRSPSSPPSDRMLVPRRRPSAETPSTVEEIRDPPTNTRPTYIQEDLSKRLDAMEKRQERIENLLAQIADGLKNRV